MKAWLAAWYKLLKSHLQNHRPVRGNFLPAPQPVVEDW